MDPGRANHWDYQSAQPPLLTSLSILATHMESTEQGWVMFRERGMGCANKQPNWPLCFWFLAWEVAAQSSQSGPPTCPHLPPSLSIPLPLLTASGGGAEGRRGLEGTGRLGLEIRLCRSFPRQSFNLTLQVCPEGKEAFPRAKCQEKEGGRKQRPWSPLRVSWWVSALRLPVLQTWGFIDPPELMVQGMGSALCWTLLCLNA